MQKRGQFTLFVIIGIVILLIIGITYYYKDTLLDTVGVSSSISYPSEVQEIVDYTEECLYENSVNAVNYVSQHAGYYVSDEKYSYQISDENSIPYAYYDNYNLLLPLESFELSFEAYMYENALACFYLNPYDNNLSLEDFEFETIVGDESVEFDIKYPIKFIQEDQIFYLPEKYSYEIPARVGSVHEIANTIIELSIEDPTYFDYDTLSSLGVNLTISEMNNEIYIFSILDPESYTDEELLNYYFDFAAFFPPTEETDEDLESLINFEEGLI